MQEADQGEAFAEGARVPSTLARSLSALLCVQGEARLRDLMLLPGQQHILQARLSWQKV